CGGETSGAGRVHALTIGASRQCITGGTPRWGAPLGGGSEALDSRVRSGGNRPVRIGPRRVTTTRSAGVTSRGNVRGDADTTVTSVGGQRILSALRRGSSLQGGAVAGLRPRPGQGRASTRAAAST